MYKESKRTEFGRNNGMIALNIEDMKGFVSKLLVHETFDKFYVGESIVRTFADFKMGGSLNKDYYASDEQELLEGRTLCLWSEVRPFAYSLIRGHKLPVAFQFIFQLSEKNQQWLLARNTSAVSPEDVKGLYMNIRYEKGRLQCVTGVSLKTFIPDKTVERLWDETVRQFFRQNGIAFTEG